MGMPVVDLGGLVRTAQLAIQNTADIIKLILKGKIVLFLIGIFSKPFYIAGLVVLFTWFPEVVKWIFIQIGLIQLKVYAVILQAVMPDIFGTSTDDINNFADIFNNALSSLPPEIMEVFAKVGVAELMGLIFTCLTSGFVIKIYFKMINRALI